jgi:hypothetical protein
MNYNKPYRHGSSRGDFVDYITIKEASDTWGVGTRQITYQVVAGRIPGAIKRGGVWFLPASAQKPEDLRKYNYRRTKHKNEIHD